MRAHFRVAPLRRRAINGSPKVPHEVPQCLRRERGPWWRSMGARMDGYRRSDPSAERYVIVWVVGTHYWDQNLPAASDTPDAELLERPWMLRDRNSEAPPVGDLETHRHDRSRYRYKQVEFSLTDADVGDVRAILAENPRTACRCSRSG